MFTVSLAQSLLLVVLLPLCAFSRIVLHQEFWFSVVENPKGYHGQFFPNAGLTQMVRHIGDYYYTFGFELVVLGE